MRGKNCFILKGNLIYAKEDRTLAELSYAEQAYPYFVNELRENYTTRACVFATLHGRLRPVRDARTPGDSWTIRCGRSPLRMRFISQP